MKNLKITKKLLLLGSSIVLVSAIKHKENYQVNYQIIKMAENDSLFKCDDSYVYIGPKSHMSEVTLNDKDVYVWDDRNSDDPNMIIYNSHNIKDKNNRNNILNCLMEYEKCFPTEWDRTIESMRNEWKAHNLLYELNYQTNRTAHVDLNNEDEEKYGSKVLTKIFYN